MLDGAFSRGTTPTHIFPIPEPLTMSDLKDLTIAYRQKNNNVIIKHWEDLSSLDGVDPETNIVVVLSQADTLMFDPRVKIVEVQIKASSIGSDVFKIGDYRLRLDDIFDEEEFNLEN